MQIQSINASKSCTVIYFFKVSTFRSVTLGSFYLYAVEFSAKEKLYTNTNIPSCVSKKIASLLC